MKFKLGILNLRLTKQVDFMTYGYSPFFLYVTVFVYVCACAHVCDQITFHIKM